MNPYVALLLPIVVTKLFDWAIEREKRHGSDELKKIKERLDALEKKKG